MLGLHKRRPLNGVLAGECRPQQQHSRLRECAVGIQAIGEFAGVPAEGADEVAVTPVEAGDDIVQRRAHLVLVEGKDALEHGSRAGVLVLEALLPGHEEPGDDPRRVGREPLRAARDEPGPQGSHCGTGEKRRACCRVESTARVDSAPWLRFTPSACRPSKPPPVSGSHMSSPASLSPKNQAAAARTPSDQIGWRRRQRRVRTRRRGWPPRSAAGRTPGRRSSAPLPATGVGDRWPSAVSWSSSQANRSRPALPQRRVVERDAGGDHRLGENGVRVGEARLGPRPRRVAVRCGEQRRRSR